MASVCPDDGRLSPDYSFRPVADGQPKTALIFISRSQTSRHGVFRSLHQAIGRQRRPVADAGAEVTGFFRIHREKDEIRQRRLVQYLTREARVARQHGELATLTAKMATLSGILATLERRIGNPAAQACHGSNLIAPLRIREPMSMDEPGRRRLPVHSRPLLGRVRSPALPPRPFESAASVQR